MKNSPLPLLKAQSVHKFFLTPSGKKIQVLQEANLAVFKGESISVHGESGVGKTTFLNVLTLLERPESGDIYWQGEKVTQKSNAWLARKRAQWVGLVFQGFYLIPELNALENVLFARRLVGAIRPEDKQRAKALLINVGLGKRLTHLTTQLSGGETQRVAIARSLMNKPQLMIADEPTGNLDEKTAEGVMNLFLNLCKEEDTTLVLVTHNLAYAKQADKHYVLAQGKLQAD